MFRQMKSKLSSAISGARMSRKELALYIGIAGGLALVSSAAALPHIGAALVVAAGLGLMFTCALGIMMDGERQEDRRPSKMLCLVF